MASLAFAIRDALRSFRRDRAYAATVILTLALTIGATTAVFSIVNGVLLQPLPYHGSQQLVSVREIWREVIDRARTLEVNERHFEHWRGQARSFTSLAQYTVLPANLTGRGDAVQITLVRSSGSLFDTLHVQAAIGRTLMPADDPEGAPDVVAITDLLWRQRFGADPGIVGSSITVDGKPHTIVGILSPEFRLPRRAQLTATVDAFVPMRFRAGWVGEHNNEAIGRLRDGVTLEQARAELDALQRQVSEIATKQAGEPVTLSTAVTPLAEAIVGGSRRGLLLLLGAIAAVLFIACANLANLSLTRTLGRMREAAVRSALGASRGRLVGRALLEQLSLAVIGGALGLWVAWMALALFVRTAPIDLPRVDDVALDVRVFAFAAVVSILAGLLVALLPAWRLAGHDVQGALRASATAVASDRRGLRSHAALLAVQVALSVTLLVVTALFGVSFARVMNVDRGFSTDQVLAIDVALPATRYADRRVQRDAYERLLAIVRALPAVQSVTTTSTLPLRGQSQVNFIAPESTKSPLSEQPAANFRFVAPEYFTTLGMAIRRGRTFSESERDPERPTPALLSEPAAERLWPGEDPIGRRFSRGIATEQSFEVVGVVADARTTSLDGTQPLMVYVPYWWQSRTSMALLIKTAVDPAAMIPAVRRAVRELDPEIAIGQSRPLEQLVDASVSGRRYQMQLFVAFGLVALFIATVGVYAVTSYSISRRRREMNIRVALGAHASQVVHLVLRQGMAPVIVGVVAGACGALAFGGIIATLLFDVRPREPWIIGAVVAIVGAVGLLTCALAARQGLSIDPAAALRDE
jgi:predicted permease